MSVRNRRVREDVAGLNYKDVTIKTGLSSLFRNKKQRRQLLKLIRDDAKEVSKCFVVFSRYLYNRCIAERGNDEFFVALDNRNGIRDEFSRFIRDPNIPERQGIILTDFRNMGRLQEGSAASYAVAVRENLKRNMRRRFVLYYEHVMGKFGLFFKEKRV